MAVAIDASVLVALLDSRDLWHAQAVLLKDALLDADVTLVTFDCVAAEAISAASRRLREKGRVADIPALLDRLNAQVPAATLTWILPDAPRFYVDVLALIRTSFGELNFNHALIALACRDRKIPAIASFDADFDQVAWLRRLATSEDVKTHL